jgi:hypothetical protein
LRTIAGGGVVRASTHPTRLLNKQFLSHIVIITFGGLAMDATQENYCNEVVLPLTKFLQQMALFPVCTQPDSNVFLHQFVGLVLAVNHFFKKRGLNRKVSESLRQISNSAKHIPRKGRVYKPELSILYEYKDENFRFVRNTIIDSNDPNEPKCDMVGELLAEVNSQSADLNLGIQKFSALESIYGFYTWAFAYHDPTIAISTKSTKIQIVAKSMGSYVPFDAANVKFVVLNHEMIGHDPSYAFPKA